MDKTKTFFAIIVSLSVGLFLGLYLPQYLPAKNSAGKSSLAQFVMNSPTPWTADIQGVVTALGGADISFQLRTGDGIGGETYTLALAPRENLAVERLDVAADGSVTTSKVNYGDLKVGDEAVLTVSSDGQSESIIISKITIIPRAAATQ